MRCLGGNSPYLSDLLARELSVARAVLELGADRALAACMDALLSMRPDAARADIAAAMRRAKRQVTLVAAIADTAGLWPLETATQALSDLAGATLRLALGHLLRAEHDRGALRLPDAERPEEGCGFVVLGMGKLGGGELNYSSDIDLIVLYDADSPAFAATEGIGTLTTRLARNLVGLMEARDANGYVFRTDLRLRPDPASTPPAVSLLTALTYYESLGETWERSAMIKARPVAGDLELGERFLAAIRPFVWRRGLDFAAIADIRAMKRRIDVVKDGALRPGTDPVARVAGHNVKLGQGGIREIEFLVQTQQMVWGGRDPTLRQRATLAAGRRLVETGHLAAATLADLDAAYRFLRQAEHRIQLVNDRQSHSVPTAPGELARLGCFMGFDGAEPFAAELLRHLETVSRHYSAVFDHVPRPPDAAAAGLELDFRDGGADAAASPAALAALGFKDHARIAAALKRWLCGEMRALRSSRARDLLVALLPSILVALGRQRQPDEAFARFDRFLGALPVGVQPMSLFHRNPALLARVAAVLGAAPMLSEHLARYPALLDGLLSNDAAAGVQRALRARLADASRLEDAIQIVRRSVKEWDFFLAVATLEGRTDANAAGRRRTLVAQAALAALVPRVLDDFAARHGRVPGGALAVVLLGKAGGREMMAGSDLDLMFVYDHPDDAAESDGAKPLPASQWFVRAVQASIAALTAPGPEGKMYELDMRLRPSGNKGPLAVSLAAFRRYHEQDAWTWERMALTRARVVAGPPAMRARVRAAVRDALVRPRDGAAARADAAAMRARVARELPPFGPWDVKHRDGGLVDIEFIAQVLQLVHAGAPGFRGSQTTRETLLRLAVAGLLPMEDAGALISADLLLRTVQGMLRLTVGRVEGSALPDASAEALLRAVRAAGWAQADTAALLAALDTVAADVRGLFRRWVGAG